MAHLVNGDDVVEGLGWRPYRRVVLLWVRQAVSDEEVSGYGAAFLHADAGDYIGVDDNGFEHVLNESVLRSLEPIGADDPMLDRALDAWHRLDLTEV